ncbi:hypothetical protein M2135_000394 [Parabacteroides sp. PF5-9]|nr:hypothetical protein [Parabacteroides sp. PF5-9]
MCGELLDYANRFHFLPLHQTSVNQSIFHFSLSVNHCNETDLSNNIKKY